MRLMRLAERPHDLKLTVHQEGMSWINAVFADANTPPADMTPRTYARALADHALLAATVGAQTAWSSLSGPWRSRGTWMKLSCC